MVATIDPAPHGASFGSLLLEQKRRLAVQAHRLAGGGADAEDLLQETLLRCWRARETFITGSSIGAWTGTIMRNVFLSGRRRASYAGERASDDLDSLPGAPGNQEAAIHLRETEDALQSLPTNQRDAVMLAGHGYTTTEGASRLRIAEGTFKSRLSRGRENLRLATGHLTVLPASFESRRILRRIGKEHATNFQAYRSGTSATPRGVADFLERAAHRADASSTPKVCKEAVL